MGGISKLQIHYSVFIFCLNAYISHMLNAFVRFLNETKDIKYLHY